MRSLCGYPETESATQTNREMETKTRGRQHRHRHDRQRRRHRDKDKRRERDRDSYGQRQDIQRDSDKDETDTDEMKKTEKITSSSLFLFGAEPSVNETENGNCAAAPGWETCFQFKQPCTSTTQRERRHRGT